MTLKQSLRLAAAFVLIAAGAVQAQVTLTHVHGLAYSGDGKRIMIPSHHGLAVYENGRFNWMWGLRIAGLHPAMASHFIASRRPTANCST